VQRNDQDDCSGRCFEWRAVLPSLRLSSSWCLRGDVRAGGKQPISCPTTSVCRAADNGGNVYTYSNGSWSAGQQVDSGGSLTSISCATASFCAATSAGDTAYVYSAGTWSASHLVGADGGAANLTSVSCPAAGSCLATGDWDSYTYSGGQWARGQLIQQGDYFTSISCPTITSCKAADNAAASTPTREGEITARSCGNGQSLTRRAPAIPEYRTAQLHRATSAETRLPRAATPDRRL
jgi:hypothetical protein